MTESQGTTTAFLRLLIKKGKEGKNEMNPFWKGVMSFDDYSYKLFNDVILNKLVIPVGETA
jgi:hypothetical protein